MWGVDGDKEDGGGGGLGSSANAVREKFGYEQVCLFPWFMFILVFLVCSTHVYSSFMFCCCLFLMQVERVADELVNWLDERSL